MPAMKTSPLTRTSREKTPAAAPRRWLPVTGLLMAGVTAAVCLLSRPQSEQSPENSAEGEVRHGLSASQKAAPAVLSPISTHSQFQRTPSAPLSLTTLVQKLASARTPTEKRAISDALIALNTEEALQAWGKALLAETDPAARRAMLEALDTLQGEAAVEMITQLVELSADPDIIQATHRTLSRMATPDTIAYLSEMHAAAASDPVRQQRVLDVLAAIRNPAAVPGLIRLAHQPDLGSELTGQAFSSLGKIGDTASLLAMSNAFDTLPPEYFAQRQQVLQAISSIQNPASRAMLADLAANSHQPLIAAAAADAVKNLPAHSLADPDASAMPSAQELIAK